LYTDILLHPRDGHPLNPVLYGQLGGGGKRPVGHHAKDGPLHRCSMLPFGREIRERLVYPELPPQPVQHVYPFQRGGGEELERAGLRGKGVFRREEP